jgi:hypothetical protein
MRWSLPRRNWSSNSWPHWLQARHQKVIGSPTFGTSADLLAWASPTGRKPPTRRSRLSSVPHGRPTDRRFRDLPQNYSGEGPIPWPVAP